MSAASELNRLNKEYEAAMSAKNWDEAAELADAVEAMSDAAEIESANHACDWN